MVAACFAVSASSSARRLLRFSSAAISHSNLWQSLRVASSTSLLNIERAAELTAQKNNKGAGTGKVIIEGLKYGDTTLTALIDGHEYSCIIHVAAPVINKESMTVKVGKSGSVSLKNTKLRKEGIKWETSDPNIALVDGAGKVYGISSGYVTIFTDAGGFHNECRVTVW